MSNTTKEKNSVFKSHFLIGLLFFSFYLLGDFFPDYWWSTHSTHFISTGIKVLLFITGFVFICLSLFPLKIQHLLTFNLNTIKYNSHVIIWTISLLMGFIFYHFPMIADFYGEAYIINPQVFEIATNVSERSYHDLFSFGLNPWAGQKTIFAFISYLSHYSGQNFYTIFIYFNAFFGICFMLTWLYFIHQQVTSLIWKTILTLAICFAPFLLNFYGHLEINAPVLWINLIWITILVKYIQKKNTRTLWLLLFLLICGLKLHAVALLFVPIWIMLCFSHFNKTLTITWKKASYYILAPIFIIGTICYFFVFKDYNDQRNLDFTVTEYDRLFLPIISPEAPLDKYNLFSFNHIFDYFSEMLLWSPIALFLIVSIVILYRKKIDWQKEELILVATTFILFASLFFVINPLLSMQMDWDLFSFPSPILLVLLVLLVRQIETTNLEFRVLPICIAIAFLNIPFFTVHLSEDSLSRKLESLGIRIYHTYYEWSSQTIHNAFSLLSRNRALQIDRKNKLLYKLADYAVEGNDREYGLLWRKDGAYFLDVHKDAAKAYVYLEKALVYYPSDNYTKLLLLESSLLLDLPKQAYDLSLQLKASNYPDAESASITTVQCALMATLYQEAYDHSNEHLMKWEKDKTMGLIKSRLQTNTEVEKLKNLFFVPK